MVAPCPKCSGRLVPEEESFRAPTHVRCLNCGMYIEAPVVIVKPEIPPPDFPLITNQYSHLPRLTDKEKRQRNREAQRRFALRQQERSCAAA